MSAHKQTLAGVCLIAGLIVAVLGMTVAAAQAPKPEPKPELKPKCLARQ